jgi:glycosyltransferase involved in cell wall biosynthesis
MSDRPKISLITITRDEEALIGQCLKSAWFCDEKIVIDSFSTDKTVEIARGDGAGAERVHAFQDDRESGVAVFQFLYCPRRVSRRRTRTVRRNDRGVLRISEIRKALRAPPQIAHRVVRRGRGNHFILM